MGNNTLHSVTYTVDDSDLSLLELWVKLEQIVPSKILKYANIWDVYRLWTAAATGTSAKAIKIAGCPVEFDGTKIKVYLGFYSWPSKPDLIYNVTPALGTIFSTEIIKKPREFSVFVDNSSEVSLDFYLEDATIIWESPCFNSVGELIPYPTAIFDGIKLKFNRECFGAVRIFGKAVGQYHVCEMILDKEIKEEGVPEEEIKEQSEYTKDGVEYHILSKIPTTRFNGYKIENLENTITATWLNEEMLTMTEQLPLEIPQCVQDILAFCPGLFPYILLWCETISTRQVYYNTCTNPAEVVAIFDGEDPQSYCSKMSSFTDPSPWLRSLING